MSISLRQILGQVTANEVSIPIGTAVDFAPNLPVDITVSQGRFLKAGFYETDSTTFNTAFWGNNTVAYTDHNRSQIADFILNVNSGVMIGYTAFGSTPIRSTDYGLTWNLIAGVDAPGSVGFSDNAGFWCLCNGTTGSIYTSRDDGATWLRIDNVGVIAAFTGQIRLRTVAKLGDVVVTFATSANTKAIRSTDAGVTWANTGSFSNITIRRLEHDGTSVWVAVGVGTTALRSTDNGITWNALTVPNATYYDLLHIGSGVFVAVGTGGTVIKISASGIVSTITSGTTSTLFAIAAAADDPLQLVAGGAAGTILTSVDAGATWSLSSFPSTNANYQHYSIASSPTGEMLSVGAGGNVSYRPPGAASSWTNISPSVYPANGLAQPFWNVCPNPNGFFFSPGPLKKAYGGAVVTSVNAANSLPVDSSYWVESKSGTRISLTASTKILRSTDSGITWAEISPGATFTAIETDHLGNWMAGASNGAVYTSSNDGATWTFRTTGTSIQKIVAGDNGTWMVLQTGTTMLRTVNGGVSWTSPSTSSMDANSDMVYCGFGVWVMASTGVGSAICKSLDDGVTWTTALSSTAYNSIAVNINLGIIAVFSNSVGVLPYVSTNRGTTWSTTGYVNPGFGINRRGAIYHRGAWLVRGSTTAATSADLVAWIPVEGTMVGVSNSTFSRNHKLDEIQITGSNVTTRLIVDVAAGAHKDTARPDKYVRIS